MSDVSYTDTLTTQATKARRSYKARPTSEKWPGWLSFVTIVGLSVSLWGLIIWAGMAIFG